MFWWFNVQNAADLEVSAAEAGANVCRCGRDAVHDDGDHRD